MCLGQVELSLAPKPQPQSNLRCVRKFKKQSENFKWLQFKS
jgi:hypothetical protein